MKSPVRLGDIKGETEKTLKAMKKKEFAIGPFTGEIYEGGGIKVFAIDNTVEIVEAETEKVIHHKKSYGEPLRTMKTLSGLMRIPTQIGHPFRSKSATYSDPIRPGIPKQTGHP